VRSVPAQKESFQSNTSASAEVPVHFLDMGSHALEPIRSWELSVVVHTSYDGRFLSLLRTNPPEWLVLDDFLEERRIREIMFESRRGPLAPKILLLGPAMTMAAANVGSEGESVATWRLRLARPNLGNHPTGP